MQQFSALTRDWAASDLSAQLRHLHVGVFTLPNVIRRFADAVLAAGLGDASPSLDLFEDPDDLFFAELRLFHAELLWRETLLPTGSNQRGRFRDSPLYRLDDSVGHLVCHGPYS